MTVIGRNMAKVRRVAVTFAPEAGVPGGFVVWPIGMEGQSLADQLTCCMEMFQRARRDRDGVAVFMDDGREPLYVGAFAVERVSTISVIDIMTDTGESAS